MYLPSGPNGQKVGLDDFLATGHCVDDVIALASHELRGPVENEVAVVAAAEDRYEDVPDEPGHAVLADVETFVQRFVIFPDHHAVVATVAWIAHTWGIECFVSTPLTVLSAEKGSEEDETCDRGLFGTRRVPSKRSQLHGSGAL